jgi:hypothetical protein
VFPVVNAKIVEVKVDVVVADRYTELLCLIKKRKKKKKKRKKGTSGPKLA